MADPRDPKPPAKKRGAATPPADAARTAGAAARRLGGRTAAPKDTDAGSAAARAARVPNRAAEPPSARRRAEAAASIEVAASGATARTAPPPPVPPPQQDAPRPAAIPPAPLARRAAPVPAWLRALSDALAVRDPLTVALVASLLLHGLVMFMRFAPPAPIKVNPNDARLEVVLLNAQTRTRPMTPDVLAQTNQEGGGENERGRAKSPLPAESVARDGTALKEPRRRIEQLEARQRELLALAKGPQAYVTPERPADATPRPEATDRDDLQSVMTRMQAEIAKNVEDYNKRPKRLTFGVNAVGVHYARYVADWATKIERIGTERYPPEARGRQYDSLIITVEIDKHGNVVDVVVNKKSKYEALNRAIKQIVYAGQPYERFPPEMAREGDILQIVRTWTFTNDALETRSLRGDR
jgi:protein TonB